MAPLSNPGIEHAERNARKRPVQPVIPVIPFVPSRKSALKSKTGHKQDGGRTTQSATPSTPNSELIQSHENVSEAVSEKATPVSIDDTPELQALQGPTNSEDSKVFVQQLSPPSPAIVNGLDHEEKIASKVRYVDEQSDAITNNVSHTPTTMADESSGVTSQVESSVVSEDVEANNGSVTSAGSMNTEGTKVNITEDVPETPKTIARETTSPEVVRQRDPKHHRRSELAPEVLSNGHQRNYSVYAGETAEPNGTTILPPALLPPIHDYLLYLANSKHLCDTVIQIVQPDQNLQPSIHYTHAIFLMRSSKLAKKIPEFDPTIQSRFLTFCPARNIQPHAFEAALRFLYSDHILSADGLVSRDIVLDKTARFHYFDYIMSYWVSGVELGLIPVQTRARDIMQEIMNWDIVESVIKEAYALRSTAIPAINRQSPSEYVLVSNSLMQIALQFIANNLDLNRFNLDTEIHTSELIGRFSQLEIGRGASNPMLASMVFGSMPIHQSTQMSVISTVSAILLNLEFVDLQNLVSELMIRNKSEATRVLSEVVDEREKRRLHAVGNRMISNKQRLSNSTAWDEAGWREYLQEGQLRRDRAEYLLPTRHR